MNSCHSFFPPAQKTMLLVQKSSPITIKVTDVMVNISSTNYVLLILVEIQFVGLKIFEKRKSCHSEFWSWLKYTDLARKPCPWILQGIHMCAIISSTSLLLLLLLANNFEWFKNCERMNSCHFVFPPSTKNNVTRSKIVANNNKWHRRDGEYKLYELCIAHLSRNPVCWM